MDVAFEQRLRRDLRASAASVTASGDLPARVERRIRGRRRQAVGVRAAAAILAVAAVGATVAVARGNGGSTEIAAPDVGSPAEGMWESLPEAPLTPRFQHAAVWTGEEMIVLGGYDGGEAGEHGAAAYSPATRSWRSLADPPGDVRGAPVAVWTGTEVIAFGGESGAAYDPRADEWRHIASSDLGRLTSSITHVAWTGEQVVVAGAFGRSEGGDSVAALYDPATDEWTRLPNPPERLPEGDAVWTGQEMVFVGHDEGSGIRAPQRLYGLALDPATETWRTLPDPPLPVRGGLLVAWTGSEIVVGGGHAFSGSGLFGDQTDAAAFDPTTGTWRPLPPAPVAFQGNWRYGDVAVDGRVIALETADPAGQVLVLDPVVGEWRLAPGPNRPQLEAPDELRGRQEAPVVSTGSSALVWGGGIATDEGGGAWGCCRPVGEGAMFTPPPVSAP